METRVGLKRTLTAGLLAVAAAVGMPMSGRGAMPPPTMQQMLGVSQKDDERKRWRRTRAQIMKRALTWRGIGMFSRGPRWPNERALPKPGRQGFKASDGTKYVIWTDGSMRLEQPGPRSKAAVKVHRAERRRAARAVRPQPTLVDRVKRTLEHAAQRQQAA